MRCADDELPDYVIIMVANKKSGEQITEDLKLFLQENARPFTDWLLSAVKELTPPAPPAAAAAAPVATPKPAGASAATAAASSSKAATGDAQGQVKQTGLWFPTRDFWGRPDAPIFFGLARDVIRARKFCKDD